MVSLFLLYAAAFANTEAGSQLEVIDCDLGEAYAFSKLDCQIGLANRGATTIHVINASPVTPRDAIEPRNIEIRPYSTTYVHAVVNVGSSLGRTRHRYDITTDEIGHEKRTASARVFALNAFDQVAPIIDFGVVTYKKKPAAHTVTLVTHEVAQFKITGILSKPDWCDVEIENDKNTVSVSLKANAPWGLHQEHLKVSIDLPQQKEQWIDVKVDMHGEVIPSINPVDMGMMRFGSNNSQLVRLTSVSGEAFEVGDIQLDGLSGEAKIEKCETSTKGCALINLRILDSQPAGAIRGKMFVTFPKFEQKLAMDVQGIILARDAVVDTIDPNRSADHSESTAATNIRGGTDIAKALTKAVDKDTAPPPGTGPLLRWSIANSKLVYGFQVFRSEAESDHFVLLNSNILKSIAEDEESESYTYRDATAVAGKTYWYYIGLVYSDGHKQQLSGPQKVVAR